MSAAIVTAARGTCSTHCARQCAQELAADLELQRDHNETLFALLLQRDRQLAAIRAELMQVRGVLGEELR